MATLLLKCWSWLVEMGEERLFGDEFLASAELAQALARCIFTSKLQHCPGGTHKQMNRDPLCEPLDLEPCQ